MIEQSKAAEIFSNIIAPVASAAGYRTTRYQRRPGESPAIEWEKTVGEDFVLRLHLQRGKGPRFYYVNLNLYAKLSEPGKRGKSRKAVLLGRLEELIPASQRLTYDRMFDCDSLYELREREQYIAEALRTYGLPTLEKLADYETIVEAYLSGCVLVDGRWFGILQPCAQPRFKPVEGIYMPVLDLPVLGNPAVRLTDDRFRHGRVALLNVWTVEDQTCRASHKELVKLHVQDVIDIYGIADRDDPEDVAAFLAEFGNPYVTCALEMDGTGSRTPCGDQLIDWRRDWCEGNMPLLMVIDANGLERKLHCGRITENVIEQEIMPAIEEAGKPYAYVPRRARRR